MMATRGGEGAGRGDGRAEYSYDGRVLQAPTAPTRYPRKVWRSFTCRCAPQRVGRLETLHSDLRVRPSYSASPELWLTHTPAPTRISGAHIELRRIHTIRVNASVWKSEPRLSCIHGGADLHEASYVRCQTSPLDPLSVPWSRPSLYPPNSNVCSIQNLWTSALRQTHQVLPPPFSDQGHASIERLGTWCRKLW